MAFGIINMGLNRDDLLSMTTDEFAVAQKAFSDKVNEEAKEKWHRLRTLASILIQPHVKKRITPQQLIPLPGDKKRNRVGTKKPERSTLAKFEKLVTVTNG